MNAGIGNGKIILLVEDDGSDLELTLMALKKQELAGRVVVVRDGSEALDYLYCRGEYKSRAGGHPAVVLLDNKMPKVSGLEVLKIIKADELMKTIPVVALTSSRQTKDVLEFYQCGVNAYVMKPVDFDEFVKTVRELGAFWAVLNEAPPPSKAG